MTMRGWGRRDGPGFSLVEVLVAVAVIVAAVAPMMAILSQSHQASHASIYEIMAVHYGDELASQLQRLSPRLRSMSAATGKSVKQLLEDPDLQAGLGPEEPYTDLPKMVPLPKTDIYLFVSALHPNFRFRRLLVDRLDTPAQAAQRPGTVWAVTVSLGWRFSEHDPVVHGASYAVILREEPP